jgi:hypothetical protein
VAAEDRDTAALIAAQMVSCHHMVTGIYDPPHRSALQGGAVRPGGAILDFELATFGPVEWDLASFGPDCEAACDYAAQSLGLRQLDERVPRVVNDVGMSRTVAYLAVAPQLPMLAEALKPSIEQWRTMPFAGGLRD